MNIFVLDRDPVLCAQYHHDVHLRKMIVETAQLLSTVHHEFNTEHAPYVYKRTHVNHPCTIWTLSSRDNYIWLVNLFDELCKEYSFRTDKVHKTQALLERFFWMPPFLNIEATEHPQCMPNEYKVQGDVVSAYRKYYKAKKLIDKNGIPMASWTKRDVPTWLNGS